jgi:hypothetical protein
MTIAQRRHTDVRTPLPLDPAVAAAGTISTVGQPGNDALAPLLADLSHVDPDDNPTLHAQLWARVQAVTCEPLSGGR